MKCLYCKRPIEGESEAFVTIPNPGQCGYRARTATKFVHAKCYAQETINTHSNVVANCIVTVYVANRNVLHGVPPTMVLHALAYRLADKIKAASPYFDGARFLKLCGLQE
jgi:hypothetical protein